MTGSNNVNETIWKMKVKNITKNTYAAFLRYEIFKVQ